MEKIDAANVSLSVRKVFVVVEALQTRFPWTRSFFNQIRLH